MRRGLVVLTVIALVVVGCGDDDDTSSPSADVGDVDDAEESGDASTEDGDGGASGDLDDPAPAGQAIVSVDGLDLTFTTPGPADCTIDEDSMTFAFFSDDGITSIGAGLNRVDGGYMGSIAVDVPEPDGEPGPLAYYPAPGENGVIDGSLFAVDGSSMAYTGPMLKQPPNDGSQPEPVDVGTGTVRATCG